MALPSDLARKQRVSSSHVPYLGEHVVPLQVCGPVDPPNPPQSHLLIDGTTGAHPG